MTADLLLQVPMGPEEQRHHLEVVQRSGAAMNRLIRDLLEVSRTDSDRLAMELVPVEPAAIVKEAWEAVRPLAADKKQRLACEIPRDLPLISADAARVQQVLSNLLGNAVKFVDEGGSIRVAATAAGGEVQFSVIDNGPGIPPEDLPRVFDRHWRARETAHLGAGLGLAISKAIVEAHGGRIWAESEPGRGTGFHFTVPVASEASAESERDPAHPGTSSDQPPVEAVAADS
jgi:signal transduction histidine kinase